MMIDPAVIERHCREASEPLRWGRDDCCQWVRTIIRDSGGPDIMAGVGDYASEREARLLMAAHGGMVGLVQHWAVKAGLRPRFHPFVTGEELIGVVTTPTGPALGIRYRNMWRGRALQGFGVHSDASCALAWSVPHG